MRRATVRLFWHIAADFFAAVISWLALFLYRKNVIEAVKHGYQIPINQDIKLFLGLLFIPLFWIFIYAMTGYYQYILRRSRLKELENTLFSSIFGVLILFFLFILDDSVSNYQDYYTSLGILFIFHFLTTLVLRLLNATYTISKFRKRVWGYRTLVIGTGETAEQLLEELKNPNVYEGFQIIGLVKINTQDTQNNLPILGSWEQLVSLISQYKIEDVIIANEDSESQVVPKIIDTIQNQEVHVKMLPSEYNMVMGMVKMNNILGAKLAEVDFEVMPYWQKFVKRGMDIVLSFLALIFCIPLFMVIATLIRFDSKGPIFFTQERIGYKGIPFKIIKFRSMFVDAESKGPRLSSESDDRRTRIGIFLRKSRLDELPQFFNVLLGQMSLVGPRPERQFFIDQIIDKAPLYKRIHRVKPGITSWGQIKYGYAESVAEMIERMKYDVFYLENMSLGLDIKIMFNTALTMIQGRGK
jgi:exopolysaccharide biosynthesis polyprenyl glycosylphosphotransferase